MHDNNRSVAHHGPPVVVFNVGQQGHKSLQTQRMVRGSQGQIFLPLGREQVGLVESGQGKKAVHHKRVPITLLRKHDAPDIAPVLTQRQAIAGGYAVVVHQFEVPYGWDRHTECIRAGSVLPQRSMFVFWWDASSYRCGGCCGCQKIGPSCRV